MSTSVTDDINVDYKPVDVKAEPDFSAARITGVVLSPEDEAHMRTQVGRVIEAGNNLSGYTRKELADFCDIKSSQFSKIVKGEAWLNIGNLGLWGFATGITPTDVIKLEPLHAPPATCISWFINGHLHHYDHDEFELFTKIISRRLGLKHHRVNIVGDEPIPQLKDPNWREMYLDDLTVTVARRIRQLREALGLSQKGFGDILGVTPDTVKRYESGKVRFNRGVYSTYRLYATTNVSPIEITKGSIHHRLRFVQEQRFDALHKIVSQLEYVHYKKLKALALSLSPM